MAQTQRHLSLIVPAQIHPALASAPKSRTKALRTLLARGQTSACAASRERLLFDLFAAEYDKTMPPPVAAVTHAYDAGSANDNAGTGWWLRADPVSLRPDGDRLLMLGNHALSLRADEAAALGAELHDVFAARGFEFSTPHPKRWYLRLAQDPCVTLTALDDVVGHDIMHHLPQAQDAREAARWRSLLNEVQMQLHVSPVNRTRAARGEVPVNSVWFWGGGPLPVVASQRFVQVWSHEPISLGLARLNGAASAAVPASGAEWLQRATLAGSHLVAIAPPAAADTGHCLEDFSATWCAPLLSALKSGAIETLDMYTEDGRVFHNTRRTLRPWFYRFI
ncbi:MAG: phosphoglycerate mutase [Gammaproteobacteria bacterium]|nr:phosphoglycerate mutase [Gammaproteobacteria bacterium]